MNKKFLQFFFSCLFFCLTLQLTAGNIKGIVTEATNQEPVVGLTVRIENLERSTKTDELGYFELKDIPDGPVLIIFSKNGVEVERKILEMKGQDIDLGTLSLAVQRESDEATALPRISLNDTEIVENDDQNQDISRLLTASRDIFVSTAAYTFGPLRFRIRGYNSENTNLFLNGVPFNDLESGRVYWNSFGGLNDVMRNRETEIGLSAQSYTFGGIGGASNIDLRASRQRKQIRASYGISNRSYNNRVMLTYSTGLMPNNWAFTFSGSRRWAQEGYIEGTSYDAWAYFFGAEKKINDAHSIGFTALGAPLKRGRGSAVTQEVYDLAGTNFFNPNWGYQNGEKRNARVANTHQPIFILRHDWTVNEKSSITTAVSYQFGRNGTTALDWRDANDPRGDYYRNLPSFIDDPEIAAIQEEWYKEDPSRLQLQWDDFYEVNRNSTATFENANGNPGEVVTGKYAQFLVEERRFDSKKFNINTNFTNAINDHFTLTGGVSYQIYAGRNFRVLNDLLGADYFIDIDRFAQGVAALDSVPNAEQNDLNNINRVLKEGDEYGYNYEPHLNKLGVWLQTSFSYNRFDFFLAGDVSQTKMWRTGNYVNGKFPEESFGDSKKLNFTNYGVKAGVTYKLDGRNYFYANGAFLTRAPTFRNTFVAPRTRDQIIPNLKEEELRSVEAGYYLRSPYIKAKVGAYFTEMKNQTTIRPFYVDAPLIEDRAFGNYIVPGINQQHMGLELAIDAQIISGLNMTAVAAIGNYTYTNRPVAIVYNDNTKQELQPDVDRTIYAKNFKVGGTPQTAYSVGLAYRGKNFWFLNVNANYISNMYIPFNPDRRTQLAVDNEVDFVEKDSEQWNEIIDQEEREGAFTVDVFGGKSFKIRNYFLYLNVGVNNILNNKNIVTGGFEQLRYDFANRDPNRFPSRYYYGFGTNYFVSLTVRL
ncbi:MAG: carboxypeptidase-like regulatory domain-containing protein [Saprospiraceae bacterium]